MTHGLSRGVFPGGFLRGFKNRDPVKPVIEACGFENAGRFADYVNGIPDRYALGEGREGG